MSDTVERVAQQLHASNHISNYRIVARRVIAIPLNEVLKVIADEQRRATEPAEVGALANVRNAINAMMEEPTP